MENDKKTELKEKLKNINLIEIISLVIAGIIGISICIFCFLEKNIFNHNIEKEEFKNNLEIVNNQTIENTTQIKEKIKVHITGEIKISGVYELEEGSRIEDVIKQAGGTTIDADLSKVNLAYELEDGQKIKIPSINEENNGNYISETSGENIIEGEETDAKININTATQVELTTLNGIGESTAEKIIKYREENGKFKNIEDIKNVSGIGESKYNQIKDYIKTK